jgi:WD40 repeat protein
VLTGSWDGTAKLWNADTGALVRTFTGHGGPVYSATFSPNGSQVLTGSLDCTAKLWNADTGMEIRSFTGDKDGVGSVAFSPNGTKVLTGSWDGLARLWPTPIAGSIVINNNRTATKSPNVTLALTRSGGAGTGVARMRFSNDGATWSAWEDVAATKAWTLLEGTEGYKTVRVQFMDKLQNRSAVYNDYILLDTVTPTGGILINNGAATTTKPWVTLGLSWADTGSGMVRVRLSDNGSTWTAWIRCNPFYSHKLPAGSGYHTVRAQYSDAAGNYSPVYNDYIKVVAP